VWKSHLIATAQEDVKRTRRSRGGPYGYAYGTGRDEDKSDESDVANSDFALRAAIIFNGNDGAYKIRLVTNDFLVGKNQILQHIISEQKADQTESSSNNDQCASQIKLQIKFSFSNLSRCK